MNPAVADLQQLSDERAITRVLYQYCRGIDRRDFDAVRDCFHPDAIDDHGVYRGPIDGLIAMAGAAAGELGGLLRTVHSLSNILIDIRGDRAVSEAQILAFHEWAGTPGGDELIGGRYVDEFERRDGTWRIRERLCVFEWSRRGATTERFWDRVPGQFTRGAQFPHDPLYAFLARLS